MLSFKLDLEQEVEWNPGEEDVSKRFDDREDTVDDPIRQPFCVVILLRALNGLDAVTKQQQ